MRPWNPIRPAVGPPSGDRAGTADHSSVFLGGAALSAPAGSDFLGALPPSGDFGFLALASWGAALGFSGLPVSGSCLGAAAFSALIRAISSVLLSISSILANLL